LILVLNWVCFFVLWGSSWIFYNKIPFFVHENFLWMTLSEIY
jgi:hypothetical protein